MKTRAQIVASRKSLLSLAPEIFGILEAYLELRELATLIRTSKYIKQHFERFLHKKVYISCRSRATDTKFFVTHLHRHPEVVPWIHKFVIDEYDVEYLPQLLAFTFPNLENLILQHEGPVKPSSLGRRKLNSLYKAVQPQPALLNLTFDIDLEIDAPTGDYQTYSLPASAATIFQHPNLIRMQLNYLDLTAFDHLLVDYFIHTRLGELNLWRCKHSSNTLQQLVHPSKSLAKLWIVQHLHMPFPEHQLPTVLYSCKETLRVIKLTWSFEWDPWTEQGMDFRSFPNLHSIMIYARLLLGSRYAEFDGEQLSDLIRSALPPNLMILALEALVPIVLRSPLAAMPSPPPLVGAPEWAVVQQPVPEHDVRLIEHILRHKEELAPKLEWLVMYHLEDLQAMPEDVAKLAEEKGVKCCCLYEYDEIAPPVEIGAEGSRGSCTTMAHKGGVVSWPSTAIGNY